MSDRRIDMHDIRAAIVALATGAVVFALTICALTPAPAQAAPAPTPAPAPASTPTSAPAPAPAPADTFATITPSLSPNRLGAKGVLTFAIQYTGGDFGVPSPVRRTVLQFPAGLTLNIPDLRSCPAARLRARGGGVTFLSWTR